MVNIEFANVVNIATGRKSSWGTEKALLPSSNARCTSTRMVSNERESCFRLDRDMVYMVPLACNVSAWGTLLLLQMG